jgi:acetyltransferase-like isoleucine patch superfamily enzyme
MGTIHPTAVISARAVIGDDVTVGAFTLIHDGVRVGAGSVIGSHCSLGEPTPLSDSPLLIGERSLIRSHSVFYAGSTFGPGLSTGHAVTVRENVSAGARLQIGTNSDLQGDTVIGDDTRLHSNVFVAKETRLGSFVWLFPHVVLTNDAKPPSDGPHLGPTIEDFAAVAAATTVLPGVRIGRGAVVGAHSTVTRDVGPDRLAVGSPAKDVGPASAVRLPDGTHAYPWRSRFHRGYPEEAVAAWQTDPTARGPADE